MFHVLYGRLVKGGGGGGSLFETIPMNHLEMLQNSSLPKMTTRYV